MTKAPTSTENLKSNMTTQKRIQKLDYTTIADRLRTVSLGNDSQQTGVVKLVNEIPTANKSGEAKISLYKHVR